MKILISLFTILLLSHSAKAAELPFQILGQGGPSLAANGFPLTYFLQVKTDGVNLKDLIKSVELKASYRDGKNMLLPRKGKWSYPYTDTHGLLQFLFIIPEDQPKGFYHFSGYLEVHTKNGVLNVPLKDYVMEIGGPH